mmetsp:Transcript_82891/g.149552  ORF Transcript_82891/g.149552 Transcript_82891/m.149552 type:complete len:281 (+) Transcript_82891:135-977(+)
MLQLQLTSKTYREDRVAPQSNLAKQIISLPKVLIKDGKEKYIAPGEVCDQASLVPHRIVVVVDGLRAELRQLLAGSLDLADAVWIGTTPARSPICISQALGRQNLDLELVRSLTGPSRRQRQLAGREYSSFGARDFVLRTRTVFHADLDIGVNGALCCSTSEHQFEFAFEPFGVKNLITWQQDLPEQIVRLPDILIIDGEEKVITLAEVFKHRRFVPNGVVAVIYGLRLEFRSTLALNLANTIRIRASTSREPICVSKAPRRENRDLEHGAQLQVARLRN